MRFAFLILLLAQSCWSQLITSGLVVDLQAGVGITNASGYISGWADQSPVGTNFAVQPDANMRPYAWTDYDGRPVVVFDTLPDLSTAPFTTNCLYITNATLFATRQFTLYWVGTGPQNSFNASPLKGAGLANAYMLLYSMPANNGFLAQNAKLTTLPCSLNRSIYVCGGSSTSTVMQINNLLATNTANVSATVSNITLGNEGTSTSTRGAITLLNRYLLYTNFHNPTERAQNVAALAALFNVQTNYTKLGICVGDSITEGSGETNAGAYPSQLARRYPEILWFNAGKTAKLIGSNNVAGLYLDSTNNVDRFLTNASVANVDFKFLIFKAGFNDGSTVSSDIGFQRWTNYFGGRRAAGWTNIYTTTLAGTVLDNPRTLYVSNFNRSIRAGWSPWASAAADSGFQSPYENRLTYATNATYFWDLATHPNPAGYEVMVEHIQMLVNQHRRCGFF